MKIVANREELAAAFSLVGGIVPKRTPKEILKNIKLIVQDGDLTLVATDQEVGIRHEVATIEADGNGEALIPAGRVGTILNELSDETIELVIEADAAWIRGGMSEFRLSTADPAEFPTVAGFESSNFLTLPGEVLRTLIRRTVFACDSDSTRYALGGVLVELDGDVVTFAATDSRRLAVAQAHGQTDGESPFTNKQPVIPAKSMHLIDRSIPKGDTSVDIAINANDALIRCGRTTIYTRLVEGRFPRWRDVVPKMHNASIGVMAGTLHSSMRQAQLMTDADSRGVDFTFGNGLLLLESESASVGRSKISQPISFDDAAISMTLDPKFVADFVKVLTDDATVTIDLIDGEKAAVLRFGGEYTYVVMPLARNKQAGV